MAAALNFTITIGDKDISNKAVKSFDMERNFSDVSNKFTLTIIDHPSVSLTDLEIYMGRGYRLCQFTYSDDGNPSAYQQFSGQIFDYTTTFVGDMKELTVTGRASRVVGKADTSGSYTYNIDWNAYYNKRIDDSAFWNVMQGWLVRAQNKITWLEESEKVADGEVYFMNSATTNKDFLNAYTANSVTTRIKGPHGTIDLPIPDVFTEMLPHKYEKDEDGQPIEDEEHDSGDVIDPDNRFWGKLKEMNLWKFLSEMNAMKHKPAEMASFLSNFKKKRYKDLAKSVTVYIQTYKAGNAYSTTSYAIRGFQLPDQKAFIQLNPKKKYYGAGALLTSQNGVDISYIVKQLAKLEGWEEGNIVQTEMVPCSDKFKMQNQTALEFIQENLIPLAVTPVGEAKTLDGGTEPLTQGYGGFHLYFTDNKVNFEPLTTTLQREITNKYTFGYNVPNSKVISFQVDTKGAAFYQGIPVVYNGMSIVTGTPMKEVVTQSESSVANQVYTKGHSEALDAFFGYTYEEIEEKYGSNKTHDLGWVGFDGATTVANGIYQSDMVQNGLVNDLPTSGEDSSTAVIASAADVYSKMKEFSIQATLTVYGSADVSPNSIINVTNMVKSDNPSVSEVHPTSGKYLVLKQKDSFANNQYIQTLSLLKSNGAQINPLKIDWTKSIKTVSNKLDTGKKNNSSSKKETNTTPENTMEKDVQTGGIVNPNDPHKLPPQVDGTHDFGKNNNTK